MYDAVTKERIGILELRISELRRLGRPGHGLTAGMWLDEAQSGKNLVQPPPCLCYHSHASHAEDGRCTVRVSPSEGPDAKLSVSCSCTKYRPQRDKE